MNDQPAEREREEEEEKGEEERVSQNDYTQAVNRVERFAGTVLNYGRTNKANLNLSWQTQRRGGGGG